MTGKSSKDHAGVKIPPPLCFGSFLGAGILIQSDWVYGRLPPWNEVILGLLVFIAGFAVILLEAYRHHQHGTNVEPWKPTTEIITTGFYKYSRNPIYVGMIVSYIGGAIMANSWLAILLLPIPIWIIRFHVIAKEEAYLEDKFGKDYKDYKSRVRRWI
ncbi:methyltransferase family protein [Sneathiella limimaris]|uniref:methyltransferase family protein n=1 Tax=Sneathiella limimaris TaxID=1964213 RepID=UPI00146B685D|nr:isoprenylcysteine carboxylmethyltransferase family protein [Sneathiella limimaris]